LPKNEEGEFELILGNRQLLSVFFIVVILLGVFFTMGYIVGRNSMPLVGAEIASARKPDVKPLVVDSPAPKTEPPPAAPAAQTAPAETPAAAPPAVEKQKPPEKPKAEPPRAEKAAGAPAPGQTYLQLAATTQREAEALVDVLRKNQFKASIQEVPDKPGLFRVLVGPLGDADVNKARADLQGKGFPGNAAIKRTF